MDDSLRAAVDLFNDGRFSEFQDAIEKVASATRAVSERHFYALLGNLAEALLQLSDGDIADAEGMISGCLRKLDEFMPRFRGLNVETLREDFRRIVMEIREVQAGRRTDFAPSRMPRLRILPE